MSRATFLALLIVAAYIGLEAYGVKKAQHRLEPLYIFDQFVGARQAMERCGDPAAGQREDFLANLAVVARRAAEDLRERNPDASEAQLEALLDERRERIAGEVAGYIAAGGCEHEEIWTMMKRYEIRARLNLG